MHRPAFPHLAILVASTILAACGGAASPSSGPDGEAQAARGAKLYADNCASCHGASGEGSKGAPAVVGKNALPLDPPAGAQFRKVQFHTVLDVAGWVVKNMPPKAAGSLKESEYWDIMAFDLKANGVAVADKHVDATSAAQVKLH